MKKIFMLMLTVAFLSCGVSKEVRNKGKVIKGNWTLNKITYSKTGEYNVTLFRDANKQCFEGSTWRFIPNNSSGTYAFQNGGCSEDERGFIFIIQEVNESTGYFDFLLKPKNNEDNVGYRVELVELNDNTMLWQQNIVVDGAPFLINMNFIKQ
jgi:hypothetical protein